MNMTYIPWDSNSASLRLEAAGKASETAFTTPRMRMPTALETSSVSRFVTWLWSNSMISIVNADQEPRLIAGEGPNLVQVCFG